MAWEEFCWLTGGMLNKAEEPNSVKEFAGEGGATFQIKLELRGRRTQLSRKQEARSITEPARMKVRIRRSNRPTSGAENHVQG